MTTIITIGYVTNTIKASDSHDMINIDVIIKRLRELNFICCRA